MPKKFIKNYDILNNKINNNNNEININKSLNNIFNNNNSFVNMKSNFNGKKKLPPIKNNNNNNNFNNNSNENNENNNNILCYECYKMTIFFYVIFVIMKNQNILITKFFT